MNKLKPEQANNPRAFVDLMWKIGYGLTLASLSIILFFVVQFLQEPDAYTLTMALGFILMWVLVAPVLVLLIAGRRLNRLLRFVGKLWVWIAMASLLFLSYGFLQDFYGTYCTGFFGVQTSCVSNQSFIWILLFFNPYSFLTLVGLSLLGLLTGWIIYNKKRPRSVSN